jgi:2-polyprenyl-3-methyl-5-hydroxy-6-metoxy-1,4-benzoquinol methylase
MTKDRTSAAFFEAKYQHDPDPWGFASSAYERGRYEAIFNALSSRHYKRGFEPGCSVGMLTTRLASICDQVEATDISRTVVTQARKRCQSLTNNVNITCGALPRLIPAGSFDLIVLSEMGYYFTKNELFNLGEELVARLSKPGVLLAAHWLGTSRDHLLSGDLVHQILGTVKGLSRKHSERHAGFRLDRWRRI